MIHAPSKVVSDTKPGVLCVDDEQDILDALKRTLRTAGCRIFTAISGQEGLNLLEREPISLVISDMRMPEMNGAAFLGKVAHKYPGTVRMLLTGYSEIDAAISAINDGHIYIAKLA